MRVWVIILLLFAISFTSAYTNRKSAGGKSKDVSTGDKEKDLPETPAESTELAEDEEEEERKPATKKTSKKEAPKKSKAKEQEEEEEEEAAIRGEEIKETFCSHADGVAECANAKTEEEPKKSDRKQKPKNTDDPEAVCDDDGAICACDPKQLDCHGEDAEYPLETANIVVITKKGVVVETAIFSHNNIKMLKKSQILPNREKEVRLLDLTRNKISKIEAEAFEEFKNLGKLYLGNNSLVKITPEMLKGLEGLHTLDLKYNKFTSLPDGIFKNMKNLTKLILDGNKITIKKETFEGLDKLEELSLDDCQLPNKMDSNVFDNLVSLKKLSMRKNPFTDVPAAMKSLTKLIHLDLSETDLTEIHSASFHEHSLLKTIRMENMTYLYNIQERAFCGMNSLEELHLANNLQLYEIHYDAFGFDSGDEYRVNGLKFLDISNCNITSISEDMIAYENLEKLVMGGNPLNCTCETAFLLGPQSVYEFEFISPRPKCAWPSELKGTPFVKADPFKACPQMRKAKTMWRGLKTLSLLVLMTLFLITIFVLYTKGHIHNLLKNARNGAPAFPSMTYSNLNNTADDGRTLENDFQPRPEEV